MTATTVTRHLAAILAADAAEYARLMNENEESTHTRLTTHMREVVEPKIREHFGRTFKTTGDGLLAEFPSVVDAVRCAAEIQRAMIDRDLDFDANQRVRFRIGVNLGDVISESADIYGDGVNIASRLEGLAVPGGICISSTVRDHVGERLSYVFDDMGEQNIKNIARPIRVFSLGLQAIAEIPPAKSRFTAASVQPATQRLSIIVLPLTHLGADREQQYFADAVTEDLTVDLSRLENMLVISGSTAFVYRGKPVDTKEIGRELGVRYLLRGSVRCSGGQVRVSVQLIDTATDVHLSAERFDGDMHGRLAFHDEIISRLANALGIELIATEAARSVEHPDALDHILRGRAALLRSRTPAAYAEAIDLFRRALTHDPQSAEAQTYLASALVGRVLGGITKTAAADLVHAEQLIDQALAVSPGRALAHLVKGQVLRAQSRYEDGVRLCCTGQ